jgi:hypothetical protein
MGALRSIKNQYLGVNAHLHSFWQSTGTWNRAHNAQITHLLEGLRAQLLPLGYVAEMEESLQIRRVGADLPQRPRADLLIYDTDPSRVARPSRAATVAHVSVAELLDEEEASHPYFAISLHPLAADRSPGEPIGWIELLSPTNKGRGEAASIYLGKRRALLESGLVFVEIDYLHETPPTFPRLPDYTDPRQHALGARPYRIAVLDPRPDLRAGPANVHEFAVDDPIPTVDIPLSGDDRLHFDFGAPYRRMFEGGFHGYNLDYRAFPPNFDRYSVEDQCRIALRMLAVAEAAAAGLDLETGPFPTRDLPLEEALERLATLAGAARA